MNYNSKNFYKVGDKVIHNGVAYTATKPSMGQSPTNSKFWSCEDEAVINFNANKQDQLIGAEEYNSTKIYKAGDTAKYKKLTYRVKQGNSSKNPLDNPKYWEVLWEEDKLILLPNDEEDKPLILPVLEDKILNKNIVSVIVNQKGFDGKDGINGPKGEKGDKGDTGLSGLQGLQGVKGDVGPVGPKGDQGIQGPQGPAGLTGSSGLSGRIFGGSSNKFRLSNAGAGNSLISGIALPAAAKLKSLTAGTNITLTVTDTNITISTAGGGGTWGSITGTLSAQTDLQTALDAKVTANAGITGATKTKITYDAKGLVTAGTDATTADIADSSNKRYVTDANLVVIGNTSGTNTGNQTSIVGITGTKAQFNTAVTDGDILYVGDVAISQASFSMVG